MSTPRVIPAIFAALALAGCSSAGTAKVNPSPSGVPTRPTSPTPAPSAAPSPTAYPLGQPVGFDATVTVTVYSYKQPVAANAPPPDQAGYTWGATDVKVCVGADNGSGDNYYVNRLPWLLVYGDSTTVRASSTGYRQFPQPEYPWGDQAVPWNRCVRGWIVFPVPTSQRPTMVEYQPSGSTPPKVFDWAVK